MLGVDAMSPRTGSSGGPLPHHPAWSLAVNTERTSSVSREIFISGRVGNVCWPPRVLPAGWPGAGGEGAWQPRGAVSGAWRQGQEGSAPRLLLESESKCWNGGGGKARREGCLSHKSHNITCLSPMFLSSSLAALSPLGSYLQAFAPVWCPHLRCIFFLVLIFASSQLASLWEGYPDSLTPKLLSSPSSFCLSLLAPSSFRLSPIDQCRQPLPDGPRVPFLGIREWDRTQRPPPFSRRSLSPGT